MTPTFKALTPAGEWVEGWFDYSDKTDPVIWMPDGETGTTIRVLPETVCMATGRPDSTGKMMYEGDEVCIDGDNDIYTIEYSKEYCAFLLICRQMSIYFGRSTYTLTGKNIHDKTEGK